MTIRNEDIPIEEIIDKLTWNVLDGTDIAILENGVLHNEDYAMNWVDLLMNKGVLDHNHIPKDNYTADMIFVGRKGATYFLNNTMKEPVGIIITRDNWGKKSTQDENTRDYIYASYDWKRQKFHVGDFDLDEEKMNIFLKKMYDNSSPVGSVESGVSIFTLHVDGPLLNLGSSKNMLPL